MRAVSIYAITLAVFTMLWLIGYNGFWMMLGVDYNKRMAKVNGFVLMILFFALAVFFLTFFRS